MGDEHNPLIPAGYDIAWSGLTLLVIALIVAALVSLARAARLLASVQALAWTLVVLFVPVLGAIAWLSIGRRAVTTQPPS